MTLVPLFGLGDRRGKRRGSVFLRLLLVALYMSSLHDVVCFSSELITGKVARLLACVVPVPPNIYSSMPIH